MMITNMMVTFMICNRVKMRSLVLSSDRKKAHNMKDGRGLNSGNGGSDDDGNSSTKICDRIQLMGHGLYRRN